MLLPLLDVMSERDATARAPAPQAPPTRLVFVFFPNGANMEHWTPRATGPGFELSSTLAPLAQHRANLLVLTGLAHDKARAHGDGPGDHARSNAVFLTGAHPVKTDGKDLRAGVSVDQVAAAALGRATRFPSLELGCESGGQSGNCDSGYSCAYSSNISWRAPDAPMPNEVNPRQVFERLFGDPHQLIASGDPRSQALYRASILDAVLGEARAIHPKLSLADRHKMDEYMGSVRAVERQIQLSEKRPGASPLNLAPPTGIPRDIEDYLTLMTDLSALALQSDSTRVLTLTLANEGSNRSFPSLLIADGHHNISHHGKNPEKLEQIRRIDRFYVERFAHLLNRLDAVREMGRTLLESSLVVYGCAISDGDRHNHENLPVLLAGTAGGKLASGNHFKVADETPMCNLYLSMLDKAGVRVDKFGDSTGRLTELG
jgi:hypothetical protein